LPKGAVLLHDNDHPHIATHTAEILWKLKYDIMLCPIRVVLKVFYPHFIHFTCLAHELQRVAEEVSPAP
jgi:hypothetical protein